MSYKFKSFSVIRVFSIQEDSKCFEDVDNSEPRGALFLAFLKNLFPSRKKELL